MHHIAMDYHLYRLVLVTQRSERNNNNNNNNNKVKVIPVVIGATGTFSKAFR